MRNFCEALESCDLQDLGFEGNPFTWCNRHLALDIIYKRLDRARGDSKWKTLYPNTVVQYISVTSSDHLSILVDLVVVSLPPRTQLKLFRLETSWASSKGCEQVVMDSWNSGPRNGSSSLLAKNKWDIIGARLTTATSWVLPSSPATCIYLLKLLHK
ncbi:UNVERIFIED_CONTAM: hypothetical protein Sindi_0377300 [Sesamum indicum]